MNFNEGTISSRYYPETRSKFARTIVDFPDLRISRMKSADI
jgi:hypothetical protein